MKVRIQGKLAMAAGAAAIFASAGIALADGMPGGPGGYRPALWSGVYVGGESGWEWERSHADYAPAGTSNSFTRDGASVGVFLGYQHQFGPLVIGVEGDLISNQFDTRNLNTNCPNPAFTCTNRVTDLFTIGPRIGWAFGNWMPYATGGFATGSTNFRAIVKTTGVASDMADVRHDGWFLGGGLDWKLARSVDRMLEPSMSMKSIGSTSTPRWSLAAGGTVALIFSRR